MFQQTYVNMKLSERFAEPADAPVEVRNFIILFC